MLFEPADRLTGKGTAQALQARDRLRAVFCAAGSDYRLVGYSVAG